MINKFAALLLIGMASPYQILDWYGGRHTCHTASGALGRPRQKVAGIHQCMQCIDVKHINYVLLCTIMYNGSAKIVMT